MESQERKEKLLHDAAYYRSLTFTLVKMTGYYGRKYSDALEKAQRGEAYAFCLLGQMFEESVYHALEHRDYDYPPLGYREAAKIYYELAVLSGYPRGAFYLGKAYMSDDEYEQAEKWMLYAAEHNIADSSIALGNIYQELWKKEEKEIYLQKAYIWKQKALEERNNVYAWNDMADFYKEILASGKINDSEKKQNLVSKMTTYYQMTAGKLDFCGKRSACEQLVAIFLGDYGTPQDIEKVFLYGEIAMRERSAYAAFRIGKYLMEQTPEEQEKIIYYLERAVDYPGSVDGSEQLLKQYISEHEVPQYLCTEVKLLMELGSFYNLGRIYHAGKVVEKNMKTALYYYTRAMERIDFKEDRNTSIHYNLVYCFMLDLQKEGITVPTEVWEEIESHRETEQFHTGFCEEAAGILADLNSRYQILDIHTFQIQIHDIVLCLDVSDDDLCDLQSSFYAGGTLRSMDQKYLQDYVVDLLIQIEETDITNERVLSIYQDLVALLDYAAISTDAARKGQWWMLMCVGRRIADTCLDRLLKVSILNKIAACSGMLEKDYRMMCHDNFYHNWSVVCKKIKSIHGDFSIIENTGGNNE